MSASRHSTFAWGWKCAHSDTFQTHHFPDRLNAKQNSPRIVTALRTPLNAKLTFS